MKKFNALFLVLAVLGFIYGCTYNKNYGKLKYLASLPYQLIENSGIVTYDSKTFWVIEDGGNSNELYKVDFKGNIIKTIEVKNAKNIDWEDLAKDHQGNLYIADTGNNDNDRKNLVIYKVTNPEMVNGDKITAEKIKFNYPEQHKFPPKKKKQIYDCEAIFIQNNKVVIVTKNRAKPFNGEFLIYTVPNQKGTYEASLMGKFTVCNEEDFCQITAADISTDGKKVALLTYGRLFVFDNYNSAPFYTGEMQAIDLHTHRQLESICFLNDTTFLMSDEMTLKGKGGNLYSFVLPEKEE